MAPNRNHQIDFSTNQERVITTIIKGSLEVKLPTIWRDEEQSREVESEERRYRCAKARRKKIQSHQVLGKSRIAVFFQGFVGRKVGKVGSLKRRVRSHVARGEMKNCTPLWREAHFQLIWKVGRMSQNGTPLWRQAHLQVKMYKPNQTILSPLLEVHETVAPSAFSTQDVQSTPCFDHF